MQKGFNSDISIQGKTYHIQTEDWGQANPFLVSRVYAGGAVIKTIKVPYEEALRGGSVRTEDAVNQALRRQHNRIVDDLIRAQG